MTRAASGPELRWRSCAALPRRTSPTFETLWSSTRVMRMLSEALRTRVSVCIRLRTRATVHTEHGTRRGAGGQNSLPIRRASSGYGSLVGSFVRARFAKIEAGSTNIISSTWTCLTSHRWSLSRAPLIRASESDLSSQSLLRARRVYSNVLSRTVHSE